MAELNLPYEVHPEFQFEVQSATVDPSAFAAFLDSYSRLEARDSSLNSWERKRLEGAARDSLSAIFDALITEQDEPEFNLFLLELKQKSLRLLNDDLSFYALRHRDIPPATDLQRRQLQAMRHERYFLSQLSKETTTQITSLIEASIEEFRRRASNGLLTREDLSAGSSTLTTEIARLLNEEFERSGVNQVVSGYVGRPMRVTGLGLELSVPTAGWWKNQYRLPRDPKTLYVHTDEAFRNPKAIVYLCDVNSDNGSTSVYPHQLERLHLTPLQQIVGRIVGTVGSTPESPLHERYHKNYHQGFSSPEFRRHFSMLPKELKYNSHFGWDVLPDSELEKCLIDAEVHVMGPTGTFVVFDGAKLLHRGGMVVSGERIALQVIFGERTSLPRRVFDKLNRMLIGKRNDV